jgi:hypothetical protein
MRTVWDGLMHSRHYGQRFSNESEYGREVKKSYHKHPPKEWPIPMSVRSPNPWFIRRSLSSILSGCKCTGSPEEDAEEGK